MEESDRSLVGIKLRREDVATPVPAAALWATLDRPGPPPGDGQELPLGWHVLYFLHLSRPAELGRDGGPLDAGGIPSLPAFPRRMFGGINMRFHRPIQIGETLTRETQLTDLSLREGSKGPLCIASTETRIFGSGGLAVEETKATIYLPEHYGAERSEKVRRHAETGTSAAQWRHIVCPDPILLFRFSALTFNAHLIHIDRRFAVEVEGHKGIVVQGPLCMLLLLNFAVDHMPSRRISAFEMRARAPLFADQPFELVGHPTEAGADVRAVSVEGRVSMAANVTCEPL